MNEQMSEWVQFQDYASAEYRRLQGGCPPRYMLFADWLAQRHAAMVEEMKRAVFNRFADREPFIGAWAEQQLIAFEAIGSVPDASRLLEVVRLKAKLEAIDHVHALTGFSTYEPPAEEMRAEISRQQSRCVWCLREYKLKRRLEELENAAQGEAREDQGNGG